MMHPYRTKKKILRTALQSITRNGIRTFRVEELARTMGISKRTLYQLFPSRDDLLENCIRELNEMTRVKISFCMTAYRESPFLCVLHFAEKYIGGLYESEPVFWEDLRQMLVFRSSFMEIRKEWLAGGEKVLSICKKAAYIRPETDVAFLNERLLTDLFESRLDHLPLAGQFLFYFTMLRGMATEKGRIWLERNVGWKQFVPELL